MIGAPIGYPIGAASMPWETISPAVLSAAGVTIPVFEPFREGFGRLNAGGVSSGSFGGLATVPGAMVSVATAVADFRQFLGLSVIEADQYFDDVIQTATAQVRISLSASQTLDGVAQSAILNTRYELSAAQVLDGVTQLAFVGGDRIVSAAQVLDDVAQTAFVAGRRLLTAAQTLDNATQTGRVGHGFVTFANQTLDDVTQTGVVDNKLTRSFPRLRPRGSRAYDDFISGAAVPRRNLLAIARRLSGDLDS